MVHIQLQEHHQLTHNQERLQAIIIPTTLTAQPLLELISLMALQLG